jgi:curved DNA-binding protein CbpA
MVDYYEFLQISPNADADTIHRVYRFLAARLHPDNTESGNAENFHLLKTAYDVLSDPARRAEYDATRKIEPTQPLSTSFDFMDALDGELNRRLAVLAVLYYRRRAAPNFPEVALVEIEERMGFPRDYLDFTLWYLAKKGYIARADNAQFTLTADGVDFVEMQRVNMPVLNKMLTSGSVTSGANAPPGNRPAVDAGTDQEQSAAASEPFVMSLPEKRSSEWRPNKTERRVGAPDFRLHKLDRRTNARDRQSRIKDRRLAD